MEDHDYHGNLVGWVGGKFKDSRGAQAPHPRFSFQIWATNMQESLREALLISLHPKPKIPVPGRSTGTNQNGGDFM